MISIISQAFFADASPKKRQPRFPFETWPVRHIWRESLRGPTYSKYFPEWTSQNGLDDWKILMERCHQKMDGKSQVRSVWRVHSPTLPEVLKLFPYPVFKIRKTRTSAEDSGAWLLCDSPGEKKKVFLPNLQRDPNNSPHRWARRRLFGRLFGRRDLSRPQRAVQPNGAPKHSCWGSEHRPWAVCTGLHWCPTVWWGEFHLLIPARVWDLRNGNAANSLHWRMHPKNLHYKLVYYIQPPNLRRPK